MSIAGIVLTLCGLVTVTVAPSFSQVTLRDLALEGARARAGHWAVDAPQHRDVRDTIIPFLGSVNFYVATVRQEHGGSFDVVVAVDAVRQLYLLDSPASLRLLVSRHLRGPIPADSVGAFAAAVAPLMGAVPAGSTLLPCAPPCAQAGPRYPEVLRLSERISQVNLLVSNGVAPRRIEVIVNRLNGDVVLQRGVDGTAR